MCFYIYVDMCKSSFLLLGGKEEQNLGVINFLGYMDIVRPGTRQSSVGYSFLLLVKGFLYMSTCLPPIVTMTSKVSDIIHMKLLWDVAEV